MDEEVKNKTILKLAENISEELSGIFEENGYQLVESVDTEAPDFILTKDYTPSFSDLNLKFNTIARNIPVISLSQVGTELEFLGNNGRIILNEEILKFAIPKLLVTRAFSSQSSTQLEIALAPALERVNSLKLTGHMNVGYYTDILTADACSSDYNMISVRNFFVGLVTYISYLTRGDVAAWPLEVDYGEGQGTFVVQASVSVKEFVLEYILESFAKTSVANPFHYLFKMCSRVCNIFDVYYLRKSSRLVFTGGWLKESTSVSFTSMILSQIESFVRPSAQETAAKPQLEIAALKESVVWELERHNLPGKYLELLRTGTSQYLQQYPVVLKNIVEFIIKQRSTEADPKDVAELDIGDISAYLADYPHPQIVGKIQDIDKELILKCLNGPEIIDGINKSLAQATTEMLSDDQYRQQYFDYVINSLVNISPEELLQVDEKGKYFFAEEYWRKNKGPLVETLRSRLQNAMAEGNIDGVELELQRALSSHFNLSKEKAVFFGTGDD